MAEMGYAIPSKNPTWDTIEGKPNDILTKNDIGEGLAFDDDGKVIAAQKLPDDLVTLHDYGIGDLLRTTLNVDLMSEGTEFTPDYVFEDGKEYEIVANGTLRCRCVARTASEMGMEFSYVGDNYLAVMMGEQTELEYGFSWLTLGDMMGMFVLLVQDASGLVAMANAFGCTVEELYEAIGSGELVAQAYEVGALNIGKKIEPQYIGTDWKISDPEKPGYIANKPDIRKEAINAVLSDPSLGEYIMRMLGGRTEWQEIVANVRAGNAETAYPLGHEFSIPDLITGQTLIWEPVAYDHHEAADGTVQHTMTICMKDVLCTENGSAQYVQFDAQEAMYYAEEGLSAGRYYIEYDGSNYNFAFENDIPEGGQIVFSPTKASSYASPDAEDPIESVEVGDAASGEFLGSISGTSSSNSNLNCKDRIEYGSNNYAQSAMRQWLNSTGDVGEVWHPTSIFDRPAGWAKKLCGFMRHLPAYFIESVIPVKVPCRTNEEFESRSLGGSTYPLDSEYTLGDRFFLLSADEVNGSHWGNDNVREGAPLDKYPDDTYDTRIKRDKNGEAQWYWLRSPSPYWAVHVREVYTDGTAGLSDSAYRPHAVAPACVIG